MRGCPAYYDYNFINKEFKVNVINKVSFSLGVAFINSLSMEQLVKENILACREKFADKEFNVVFHHSLDREQYKHAYKSSLRHLKKYKRFVDWLNHQNINFVDISGSAENLINHYSDVDLHVGYRVHAHIFMNSIAKPSILIAEDGRAKGVKTVIGGIVLDSYLEFKEGFMPKVLNRFFVLYDRFVANNFLTKELISEIDYEQHIDFLRMSNSRRKIDSNYIIMRNFLKQLP